ncbi:DsbA family oxidoreductase [Jeotgalibacillus soli]|uniref:DSBA oxidoreductase n=1 Tax=Jeotgalibacillus soli TaxID=889306 RepID=A0A0C2RLR1_9BACL|nr:DsbA family oxidoreductase [Jeotgalibacillus soli]KIL42694.1 DSBA oxidoreductase [Jeotgalibacillus soli]
MKVEIWSDYVCPFCYIGKRRFEEALSQFSHRDEVEVVYKSFQLDPNAKRDPDQDVHDVLAGKYGMSREKAKTMNEQVAQQAKEVGLDYYFDRMIHTNTYDAHRLAHYAAEQGKMKELTERLLKAYFTDSLHIGDHETLARLASEVGLDQEKALAVLGSDNYKEHVQNDVQEAGRIGISGVPFFVFQQKYAVSGAQPSEAFLQVLNKVWDEENEKTV